MNDMAAAVMSAKLAATIGTKPSDFIRASGQMRRAKRPDI